MNQKPLTKEQEHDAHQVRFMKTPQEKEELKIAKKAWKASQKNEQTKR